MPAPKITRYNVWVTLFGPLASNAGIIGAAQKTVLSYASGKLEYIPVNDGSQVNLQFDAPNDIVAFNTVMQLFNERNPRNRKPISGKSYLRECRVKAESSQDHGAEVSA